MKKIIFVFGVLLLLSIGLVVANGEHEDEIEEGRKLVESNISCDELNGEQLEAIGEYYMELMHPGEAHEAMHKMMGIEEGTEYHKDFHINMARSMYCDESGMMSYGGMMGGGMMMPMMKNMMGGGNMMGSGMMGNNPTGLGFGYWGFWNIVWYLFWIGIIVLIIWLIYKFIIKKEPSSETPLQILKERYAKGEISKKQFEDMKKEIVG